MLIVGQPLGQKHLGEEADDTLDAEAKELLKSVERGERKSSGGGKREWTRYSRYAKATFGKNRG